jgi:hypothetical protein
MVAVSCSPYRILTLLCITKTVISYTVKNLNEFVKYYNTKESPCFLPVFSLVKALKCHEYVIHLLLQKISCGVGSALRKFHSAFNPPKDDFIPR